MAIASTAAIEEQDGSPQRFFESLAERLLHLVGQALPPDVTVAFKINGPGGGEWQVAHQGEQSVVGPLEPGPKDCTVRCSAPVFMDIVQGRLDARDAFLDGRLRLSGDIGLALRLQGILADQD